MLGIELQVKTEIQQKVVMRYTDVHNGSVWGKDNLHHLWFVNNSSLQCKGECKVMSRTLCNV